MNQRDDLYGSILPKTLIGFAAWIFIFALGFCLSGLIFFTIYQGKVNSLEDRLTKTEQQFNKRLDEKVRRLEKEIKSSAGSGQGLKVSTSESERLTMTVASSVARVEGQDTAGTPTKGSGVVVKSSGSESWIITNEHLLSGSVAKNLPVRIRVGRTELDSEVYATDPARDLALVIFKAGGMRAIPFSKTQPQKDSDAWVVGTKPGTIFGTSATKIKLGESNASSLQLAANTLDPVFSGGALLDTDAKALGILSIRGSAPPVAIPIRMACFIVLRCPAPAPPTTPSAPAGTPGAPVSPGSPLPTSPAPAEGGSTNDTF